MAHLTPANLQKLIGLPLDDAMIEDADWRDYYPLTLDHRTVNGIIHRDEIQPGDAVILELYIARGDDTPWNLEEVASQIEREWHTSSRTLDRDWYNEAYADLDPTVAISEYPTVTSCILSYYQLGGFRARIQTIAKREGYDPLTVLLVISRVLHDAYRSELTEYVTGSLDDHQD